MDDELVGEDPILAIRLAVSRVLRVYGINQDHKRFVDAVAAALPDFFRQPLQPLQPISEHTSQSTKADIVGRDVDQTYGAGVMGRGIIKGARAIWTPTTKSGGPYEVEITGNDHGRVYCLFDGKEHGDYECAFELIKESDSHSRGAK